MAIPVNEPLLGQQEMEYVTECLRTGWISSAGRFIEQFEERWAAYCSRKYGVAVSNGTTALELAVEALDLQPGDEVILPTFTIISCATAVVYGRRRPVLGGFQPPPPCPGAPPTAPKITPRPPALPPVHIH